MVAFAGRADISLLVTANTFFLRIAVEPCRRTVALVAPL
jgi:hypothetical protein